MKWFAVLLFLVLASLFPWADADAAAADVPSMTRHLVVKDECLSVIAHRYHVKMRLILAREVNPVLWRRNNPDLIYAGETISIPNAQKVAAAPVTVRVADAAVADAGAAAEGTFATPPLKMTTTITVNDATPKAPAPVHTRDMSGVVTPAPAIDQAPTLLPSQPTRATPALEMTTRITVSEETPAARTERDEKYADPKKPSKKTGKHSMEKPAEGAHDYNILGRAINGLIAAGIIFILYHISLAPSIMQGASKAELASGPPGEPPTPVAKPRDPETGRDSELPRQALSTA